MAAPVPYEPESGGQRHPFVFNLRAVENALKVCRLHRGQGLRKGGGLFWPSSRPFCLGLFPQVEGDVFSKVVPSADGLLETFDDACQAAVDILASAGHRSIDLLATGIENEGSVVILDLVHIYLGELPTLLGHVEKFSEGKTLVSSRVLGQVKRDFLDAACRALDALSREILSDGGVPDSATVSVMSSNTARACRRLAKYRDQDRATFDKIAAEIRSVCPKGGVASRSTDGDYASVLVVDLLANIEAKEALVVSASSTTASSRSGQAALKAKALLFSVSNFSYLKKNLPSVSGSRLENLLLAKSGAFCSTFDYLLVHLAPIDEKSLVYKGKALTFESGRVLKGRFDGFNTDFEDFLRLLSVLSVPDTELRDSLRSAIVARVVPPLSEFYGTYASIRFSSKHQEQYVRNSPEVVTTKIEALFA